MSRFFHFVLLAIGYALAAFGLAFALWFTGRGYPFLLLLIALGSFLDALRLIYWRRRGLGAVADLAKALVFVPVFWAGLYAPCRALTQAAWRAFKMGVEPPAPWLEVFSAGFGLLVGASAVVAAGRMRRGAASAEDRGQQPAPTAAGGERVAPASGRQPMDAMGRQDAGATAVSDGLGGLLLVAAADTVPDFVKRRVTGPAWAWLASAVWVGTCGGLLVWEIPRLDPARWTLYEIQQYAPAGIQRDRYREMLASKDFQVSCTGFSLLMAMGDLDDEGLYRFVRLRVVPKLRDGTEAERRTAVGYLDNVAHDHPVVAAHYPDIKKDDYNEAKLKASVILIKLAMGSGDPTLTPAWLQMARSSDAGQRAFSVYALGAFGAEPSVALPVLREALRDPEFWVRLQAVKGLGELGPAARDAEPDLRKARQDENWGVRGHAHIALAKLSPGPEAALEALMFFIRWSGWQPSHRTDAARLAGAAGVPMLREALKDGDRQIRERVIEALGDIGPPAAVALPDLLPPPWKPDEEWEARTTRAAAASAAIKIGLPAVFDLILTGDADTRRRAVDLLAPLLSKPTEGLAGLIEALRHSSPAIRREMADLFGRIPYSGDSTEMPPIARALAEAARRETAPAIRLRMELAAWKYEPWDTMASVEVLTEALREPEGHWRARAMDQVMKAGPGAVAAVPALIVALQNPESSLRRHAAETLGSMGAASRPAVSALREILRDTKQDYYARRPFLEALVKIEEPVKLMDPLFELLREDAFRSEATHYLDLKCPPDLVAARLVEGLKDPAERLVIARALSPYLNAKIMAIVRARSGEIVSALVAMLGEKDVLLRVAACESFKSLGSGFAPAVPALGTALSDPSPAVRAAAMEALKYVGSAGLPAIPALLKAVEDPDVGVRRAAVDAIVQIWQSARTAEPDAEAAVPVLVRALGDGDARVRGSVPSALYYIGPKAGAAVPALTAMLRDGAGTIRSNAASALGNMGQAAVPAVPALILCLRDPDKYASEGATAALWRLGPVAKDAVPELVRCLRERRNMYWTTKALEAMGSDAADAVPSLVEALKDGDKMVGGRAAEVLGNLGLKSQIVVPALTGCLKDPEAYIRRSAATALGRFGPDARSAVPALEEALKGATDPKLKGHFENALSKIIR